MASTVIPFIHPSTVVVNGPTGCGKTELVKAILMNKEKMFQPAPDQIVWHGAERQPRLEAALKEYGVEFRQGLPSVDEYDGKQRVVLVVDDFMSESGPEIAKLFTKGSHHRNITIFFLTQNFYYKGKEMRTITLNAQYIVLFKNPRDKQQIKTIARQMFDTDAAYMLEAYNDATSHPHGYLLVDMKQATSDMLRLRTNITPEDTPTHVYIPKSQARRDIIDVQSV